MAEMRFFLICMNITVLFLLGVYLLNLFGVRSYDAFTFVYMFVAAVAVVLIASEFAEKYKMKNPIYFVLPGIMAIAAPLMTGAGRPNAVALALGWLLLAPGIVLLSRLIVKKKE